MNSDIFNHYLDVNLNKLNYETHTKHEKGAATLILFIKRKKKGEEEEDRR